MSKIKKFKKGAAAFYIVAISTLVLLILAVSFATTMISEVERTQNDDLSQSAYDAAMAGIEDAKLAFYSYRTCKTDPSKKNCSDIIDTMENKQSCDMVGQILDRYGNGFEGEGEVMLEESTTTAKDVSNNMQQAYTCVKINTVLADYRSTLTATNPTRVVKVSLEDGKKAEDIKKVVIEWSASVEDESNYPNFSSSGVIFPSVTETNTAIPPVISVAMVQTAGSFKLSDFEETGKNQTNRGMVYLVPTNESSKAETSSSSEDLKKNGNNYGDYNRTYSGNENVISASEIVKSNDRTVKNLPYLVYCENKSCSVTLELPEPIGGGGRNDDTFMFVMSLPYGRPSTDFSVKLCTDDECQLAGDEDGGKSSGVAKFSGAQVQIDSTGRANDLYRRVETRMESSVDSSFISLLGPLEIYNIEGISGTSAESLFKNYTSVVESGNR